MRFSFLLAVVVSFGFLAVPAHADSKKKHKQEQNPWVPVELKARIGSGKVTITQGGKEVCVVRSGKPIVQDYRFIQNQSRIVVKSRGDRGSSLVELFNATTGKLQDKILAKDVKDGKPGWAKWAAQ